MCTHTVPCNGGAGLCVPFVPCLIILDGCVPRERLVLFIVERTRYELVPQAR